MGWRDKRDVVKFVNRKEGWRFPVRVAAWQLSGVLSKCQYLLCNSVEMRSRVSHSRLVAPETKWCRNATLYLLIEERNIVAGDRVSVIASPHGCFIELLEVIFGMRHDGRVIVVLGGPPAIPENGGNAVAVG